MHMGAWRHPPSPPPRCFMRPWRQAKVIAEILQTVRPDVFLINEFDYYPNMEVSHRPAPRRPQPTGPPPGLAGRLLPTWCMTHARVHCSTELQGSRQVPGRDPPPAGWLLEAWQRVTVPRMAVCTRWHTQSAPRTRTHAPLEAPCRHDAPYHAAPATLAPPPPACNTHRHPRKQTHPRMQASVCTHAARRPCTRPAALPLACVQAARLFAENFLQVSQNGQAPIT